LANKPNNSSNQLYDRVCGRELEANLLHFQFLSAFYARRDINRDRARIKGKLLDLGCGNQPYRRYLTEVSQYVGLDYPPTQECLEHEIMPEVLGDARTLPFTDHSFDGILCSQVLEHVDRPETMLREMARVLKPGGVGLISVPFFYNLHMEPHDYFRFSPYGMKELLARSGLSVSQLRGQGGVGTLLVQMFHNWLFSGLARIARRHAALRALITLAMPILLLLSTVNNLVALALDHLDRNDLRFTPNLWVVVEKPSN
jgi:ubiquinone/menaquinone biosynthesis C-methylase UbiE